MPPEWGRMVASEEAIIQLNPELSRLHEAIFNLRLPDVPGATIFSDSVRVVDIAAWSLPDGAELDGTSLAQIEAEAAGLRPEARDGVSLWRPLLDRVEYFEHAKFYVIRGHLLPESTDRLETDMGFEGMAIVDGRPVWLRGHLTALWAAQPPLEPGGDPRWSIEEWHTEDLESMSAEALMFREVLSDVLTPEEATRARRSLHEELVLEYLLTPETFEAPHPYFEPTAADRHPGVAIVDVDGDGFDDIYVTARWGRNQLLHNQGDGTFKEAAADFGLDIEDHTRTALFADFDNDGDQDAFLGRTLGPSIYLVNEGGRFVDRSTEAVRGPMPTLVSSLSAVDYDGDGLLDLYVSTYAQLMQTVGLPDDDRLEMFRLRYSAEHDMMRNRFGPPNVLLRNEGDGTFARVEDSALKLFKNTLQATWADYDNDGDQDAYIANDFAANHLFRNDGNGRFTDVTEATRTADLGFGMGAAWADYDEDGSLDLYVTNMFSKAGRRILSRFPELEARYGQMARGNTLFRSIGGERFERVSSLERPGLLVEAAGWGWGGQFVDIDNDSDLDIYTLSGYYSAPEAAAIPRDA